MAELRPVTEETRAKSRKSVGHLYLLRRLRCPCRLPGFQNRQHLLGEELQALFRDIERRAAEAERDVELEVADDLAPRLEPAQDLVGCAPACGLHEARHGTFETALACDLGHLLIGVVALHSLEVLAQKLVVVKIALDKLALVLP